MQRKVAVLGLDNKDITSDSKSTDEDLREV